MLTSLENIGKRFAQALKYLKDNNIIRAENAILAGTTYKKATLTNLKKGEYLPAQEILDNLEEKYRISTEWILRGLEPMVLEKGTKTMRVKIYGEDKPLNNIELPDNIKDIDYDKLVDALLNSRKHREKLKDVISEVIAEKFKGSN